MKVYLTVCAIKENENNIISKKDFQLTQTNTVNTLLILNSNDPYNMYRNIYGDVGDRLKNWITNQLAAGYKIQWCSIN
jgi:hypothetical protein